MSKDAQIHYRKSVVKNLAKDLQAELPEVTGFSVANVWRMKLFYKNYQNKPKLALVVREIGWSHNLVLLEKYKDDLAREFYLMSMR